MTDMVVIMIIVWSVVTATALLMEFFIYNIISAWFAVGGLSALIAAACRLDWPWQILIFVVVSFLFLAAFRPLVIKFVHTKTVPTNLDAKVGTQVKLLKDVEEGKSEIKLDDVIWTVKCNDILKAGNIVEITGMQGNKYIVKKGEE